MTRILLAALSATLALLGLFAAPARAVGVDDLLPVDQAYVLSAKAVSRERVEFTWTIAPGYYLYRHRFSVQPVDSAFKSNPLQLPAGEKHHDQFFGDVETYRHSVTAVQTGATANDASAVTFKVKYQGCADVGVCYPPQTRTLTVAMPTLAGGTSAPNRVSAFGAAAPSGGVGTALTDALPLPEDEAFKFEAIANSSSELLVRFTPAPGYYLYRDKTSFRLKAGDGVVLGAPRWPLGQQHRDEHFGDVVVFFNLVEIPLPVQRSNTAAQKIALEATFQGCQDNGLCYPPMTRAVDVELPAGSGAVAGAAAPNADTRFGAEAPATEAATITLFVALVWALFGGLILNLMPCVLPVLSFKALALAESNERGRARAHALWYAAGVLVSFAAVGMLVLALRGAGQALGWGFQLQQPAVVGSLSLLMFAIGLSLSGVVHFGAGMAGVGQHLASKSGPAGDFFTGVLAVVVASPCTAPFMGAALGYAFTAPAALALLVFLALGFGLALPFLLIGFVPTLAARLPRPGAWMDTLKSWLAFPMYLTAIWLAWVFGKQRGLDALALLLVGLLLLAMGLWWFERQRYLEGAIKKSLAWIFVALALASLVGALRLPNTTAATAATEGSVPYSAAKLAGLRAAGRPVFVDMTADWCITCKVNEKAVLNTESFRKLLADTHTTYMIGDWTNQDPEISAFLDQYHSPGVPLYVVFPANGGPGVKLPQLLSDRIVRDALDAAK